MAITSLLTSCLHLCSQYTMFHKQLEFISQRLALLLWWNPLVWTRIRPQVPTVVYTAEYELKHTSEKLPHLFSFSSPLSEKLRKAGSWVTDWWGGRKNCVSLKFVGHLNIIQYICHNLPTKKSLKYISMVTKVTRYCTKWSACQLFSLTLVHPLRVLCSCSLAQKRNQNLGRVLKNDTQ